MKLSSLFKLRETPSKQLIALLDSVTLGTNGAKYRHLNTEVHIHKADNPLHLSIERNERLLGSVTFCRRNGEWYIRYFAFDNGLQGTGKRRSKGGDGLIKRELNHFFDATLADETEFDKVDIHYAYIDPKNSKSLWMSENFGFTPVANIATQTFSRVYLPKSTRVQKESNWEELAPIYREAYGGFKFYFEEQLKSGPFYVIRGNDNKVLAAVKINKTTWVIERMPGKMGGFLTKAIPYVPVLRKLINPKKHTFLVPEAVYFKDNDSKLLTELFEGVLALEKEHLIFWWTDERNPYYKSVKDEVKWGLLHKIISVNQASLVVKQPEGVEYDNSRPAYTSGFDFI